MKKIEKINGASGIRADTCCKSSTFKNEHAKTTLTMSVSLRSNLWLLVLTPQRPLSGNLGHLYLTVPHIKTDSLYFKFHGFAERRPTGGIE